MRLGAYDCLLASGSRVHDAYGVDQISERHRHRYEVNINYKDQLETAGMRFSGMSPDGELPEIVEIPGHGHALTIDNGWQEVAQIALEFVQRFTAPE